MPWPDFQLPPNSIISTASIESCSLPLSTGVSAVYPSAQLAIYVPFRIAQPIIPTTLFWLNGGAVAGTVDMGVYDTDFNKIVSTGATTQAGTSTIQSVAVAQKSIGPGLFFFGILFSDATTATLLRAALNAELLAGMGCFQQAVGANVLPIVATPAHCTQACYPSMGLLTYPRTVV